MTSIQSQLTRRFSAPATRFKSFSCEPLRASLRSIYWLTASAVLSLTIVPGVAVAQSSPAAQAPRGTEILLLGTTGGPPLHKDRSEPSSLLIVDGRSYLIDCGIGTMRRMVRAGIRSETIGTIFITHHHPDHDLDLADVMANDFFNMDLADAAHTINIYGPPQTKELVEAAFRYISIPFGVFADEQFGDTRPRNPFVAHDIPRDGVVYQDDKIRVIAAENSHYALMPAHFRTQMKSYSYRFETPHGVIVFTGDTGPSDAPVIRLAKGADVLISEVLDLDAMVKFARALGEEHHWSPQRSNALVEHMKFEHLDMEEVGKLASKAQVKSVVLYHFGSEGVKPAAYVSGVKKYFSGPVFAGADLDRYCLGRQDGRGTSARILSPCQ